VTADSTSLRRFLARWYGRPAAAVPGEVPADGIREGLATLAAYPGSVTQNSLRDPERSGNAGAVRTIYVENQAAWVWGYRHDGRGRPELLERENEPGRAWTAIAEDFAAFYLHVAVYEALWTGADAVSFFGLTTGQVDEALVGFEPVDVGRWRWPGPRHRLWASDGLLAFSCLNAHPDHPVPETVADACDIGHENMIEGGYYLLVGARDHDAVDDLRSRDLPWESEL